MAKGDLICGKHDEALKLLDRLQEYINDGLRYADNKESKEHEALEDLDYYLCDVVDLIQEAKTMGQNMENRLKEYRESIEDLGFVRNI
jgi:hypothetical protein